MPKLAQQEHQITLIPEIRTPEGETVVDPEGFLETFKRYYGTLYTSSLPFDLREREMLDLLDRIALQWLSDRERETLFSLITSEEILKFIHTFPRGKAPSLDGIPVLFYIKYRDFLAPKLVEKWVIEELLQIQ